MQEKTVGEIVAHDYRAAAVFESYGIDFCCNGNRTIQQVCEDRNIKVQILEEALQIALNSPPDPSIHYASWQLNTLADHIESKHHKYIETTSPRIRAYLEKLCQVHGNSHPELYEIKKIFSESAGELAMHMKKEELLLFPYIRRMVKVKLSGEALAKSHFNTFKNTIDKMQKEHEVEGEHFQKISELSSDYTPPPDGCATYFTTFELMRNFERDLHLHIHLENNILFPRAIALEQSLPNATH